MSAQSTKKAIKEAYEAQVGIAFKHLVDGLSQAGRAEAEREAARHRFEHALEIAGDAFAEANRIVGG